MSKSGGSANGSESLVQLEKAVASALARIRELENSLGETRRRAHDLESVLRRFTSGELQPSELLDRLGHLESENTDLRERVIGGREGIERLLAKIRFLEERR